MLPGPRRLSRVGVGTAVRRSKIRLVMSQLGQARLNSHVRGMSGVLPIASQIATVKFFGLGKISQRCR